MADMWHVVSVTEDTVLSETGPGFVKVKDVKYMVDTGPAKSATGMVQIPVQQFNAKTVEETINAAVAHLDAVYKL